MSNARSSVRTLCKLGMVAAVPGWATLAAAQPADDPEVVVAVGPVAPDRSDDRPAHLKWIVGAELGIAGMNESGAFGFNTGVGSVTNEGSSWGARVGVEMWRFLGVEAHYIGMYAPIATSASPAGSTGYVLSGGEAVVRLTAPLPIVHPYVFGGVGYYDFSLYGSSGARAGSELMSSSQVGIPYGAGLDVPLTRTLSVGVEATYRLQLDEKFSNVMTNGIDGGDVTTFDAVVRARL